MARKKNMRTKVVKQPSSKSNASKKQQSASPNQANVDAAIRRLDEILAERRRKYREFVATLSGLPSIERAEKWLGYVVGEAREDGDEEAAVYFLSRGRPDESNVEAFIADWKHGEQSVLDDVNRSDVIWTPRGFKKGKPRLKRDVSEIFADDPPDLRYFWFRDHHNDWFADATMLRTVEWGEIGGFDDWWKKLARDESEAAMDGTEPIAASYWLFAMSRSGYACDRLRRPLMRHLEAVAFASEGKLPWLRYQFFEKFPRQTAHLAYAAHLAFAATVIPNSGVETALAESAAEALVKHQNDAGYWDHMQGLDRPSTLTTAAAIHALAVVDVLGGKRAITRAAKWLDSVQSPEGHWNGPEPIGQPTFATVLVLDAKSLAEGNGVTTATTMGRSARSNGGPSKAKSARQYKVALSFSGQIRPLVKRVANRLAERLTKDRVFYDEFHQGDLARLDLDIYLQNIYHEQSDLLVVFICTGYAQGEWPQLEWRAIRDIIKQRRGDEVIIVRDDDTRIPGILSIDGFIDSRKHDDSEIAEMILYRLRRLGDGTATPREP
jgi:hypothetical protein